MLNPHLLSRKRQTTVLGVCLSLLLAPTPARAQLDAGLKTPYQVRVVLHIAEHRLFTDAFQEQLQRELRDQLQLNFGALARVEVRPDHPLLPELRAKGLAALDNWDEVSDVRTVFLLLDYADGQYRLQTRQY